MAVNAFFFRLVEHREYPTEIGPLPVQHHSRVGPYFVKSAYERRTRETELTVSCLLYTSIPPDYERNGASALSILTDTPFFGGSLHDIATARPLTARPILRKDFIIDEYQLDQTRIIGADAVLRIAAALTPEKCHALADKAHELELEVLLEIHQEEEIDYINDNIDMIGIKLSLIHISQRPYETL